MATSVYLVVKQEVANLVQEKKKEKDRECRIESLLGSGADPRIIEDPQTKCYLHISVGLPHIDMPQSDIVLSLP